MDNRLQHLHKIMPAINPDALNDKIESLLSQKVLAGSFLRDIEAILSFYSDRTKRSTVASAALETTERMQVPAAVLRVLCSRIHQRGRQPEDDWLLAAQELWKSGLQEMRLVSICMLSEAPQDTLLEIATNWATESDDPKVLRSLAAEGLQGLYSLSPANVLELAENWIAEDATRTFGLLVLRKMIQEKSIRDLPVIFEQLAGLTSSVRGVELGTLQDLLALLAARSPAETTAYLLDEIESGDPRAQRFLRDFRDKLPEPYRSQIQRSA